MRTRMASCISRTTERTRLAARYRPGLEQFTATFRYLSRRARGHSARCTVCTVFCHNQVLVLKNINYERVAHSSGLRGCRMKRGAWFSMPLLLNDAQSTQRKEDGTTARNARAQQPRRKETVTRTAKACRLNFRSGRWRKRWRCRISCHC